jgi:hypothetical protein
MERDHIWAEHHAQMKESRDAHIAFTKMLNRMAVEMGHPELCVEVPREYDPYSEDRRRRIVKLLEAKLASTTFEGERAALRAKIEELKR